MHVVTSDDLRPGLNEKTLFKNFFFVRVCFADVSAMFQGFDKRGSLFSGK